LIVTLDVNLNKLLTEQNITSVKAVARGAAFNEIRSIGKSRESMYHKVYVDMTSFAEHLLTLPEFINPNPVLYHMSPSFVDLFRDLDIYMQYFPNVIGFIIIDDDDNDLLARLKVAFSSFDSIRPFSESFNVYDVINERISQNNNNLRGYVS